MRTRFDEQLSLLNRDMIELGSDCEQAIQTVSKAMRDRDTVLAAAVPALNEEISRSGREIEALCMRLLLLQQPVARDLRQISAALKMIYDLQRIGELASDMSDLIVYLKTCTDDQLKQVDQMADEATAMVTCSIDAFVKKDETQAEAVIAQDDIVDALFVQTKNGLTKMIAEDSDHCEFALDLLMMAKYFEKIGDHAVNIAEWVVFSLTGVHRGETEL